MKPYFPVAEVLVCRQCFRVRARLAFLPKEYAIGMMVQTCSHPSDQPEVDRVRAAPIPPHTYAYQMAGDAAAMRELLAVRECKRLYPKQVLSVLKVREQNAHR